MSRGKKKEQNPPAPPQFRTSPFDALKGVSVEAPPLPEPVKPAQVKPPLKEEPLAEDIFRQAMAGVRPLDGIPLGKTKERQGSLLRKEQETGRSRHSKPLPREEVVARKAFLLEVDKLKLDVRFDERFPEDEELKALSGNRLRQVKRGIVSLDRQLDLHGLTREEALEALPLFLASARQAAEKAVLIITGKGNRSVSGPVLQQAVTAWLKDQGREMVSEYAPAPQALGGSGAFVVFLRPLDKTVKE